MTKLSSDTVSPAAAAVPDGNAAPTRKRSRGRRANASGRKFEDTLAADLRAAGFREIPRAQFVFAGPDAVFCRQFLVGTDAYGPSRGAAADFALYHPLCFPNGLLVEARWQRVSGSVDTKLPFLLESIRNGYGRATVVVIDGGGARQRAVRWLKERVDGVHLLAVLDRAGFQNWLTHQLQQQGTSATV